MELYLIMTRSGIARYHIQSSNGRGTNVGLPKHKIYIFVKSKLSQTHKSNLPLIIHMYMISIDTAGNVHR